MSAAFGGFAAATPTDGGDAVVTSKNSKKTRFSLDYEEISIICFLVHAIRHA